MNLKQENTRLKSLLYHAKKWMQREVQSSQKEIMLQDSQEDIHRFFSKNLESMIEDTIYRFFPSDIIMYFPETAIDNILSAELIYYHIIHGARVDGTGAIIGYQKVLDGMIELYITKWFRKYIKKHKAESSPANIPLEKSFHSIINKKYTLSAGRLYEVLSHIKKWELSSHYISQFASYLESRPYLQKALQADSFFIQLETLIHMHALWEKRHTGSIWESDMKKARSIFIWDFKNTNCLLYSLAASQSVII